MAKSGKLFGLGLGLAASLWGFEVKVQYSPKVGLNQNLVVKVEVINGKAEEPVLESSTLTFLGINGRSTSMNIANFTQVERKTTYQCNLKPTRLGTASFKVKVGNITKGPFKVEVVKRVTPPSPSKVRDPNDRSHIFGGSSQGFEQGEAFIRNKIRKKSVYVNEPVIVDTVLYYRVNLRRPSLVKNSQLDGVSVEENKHFSTQSKTVRINDVNYSLRIIRSRVLFPLYAGKKILKGEVIRLQKQGGFFGGPVRDIPIPNISFTVKALPKTDVPREFKGAVGDFSLSANLDKKKVSVHDPLTLTLTLRGKGNLKALASPSFVISDPYLRIKQSGIKSEIDLENGRHVGQKTVQYYIIPLKSGRHIIPPIRYAFFNPKKKVYVTVSTPSLTIEASARRETGQLAGNGKSSIGRQQKVERVEEDIHFIVLDPKERSIPLSAIQKGAYSAAGMTGFLSFWLYAHHRRRERKGGRKDKKRLFAASARALKRAEMLPDDRNFYRSIEEALIHLLGEMLDIPSGISMAEIRSRFQNDPHFGTLVEEITDLIKRCQSGQYAPTGGSEEEQRKKREEISRMAEATIAASKAAWKT